MAEPSSARRQAATAEGRFGRERSLLRVAASSVNGTRTGRRQRMPPAVEGGATTGGDASARRPQRGLAVMCGVAHRGEVSRPLANLGGILERLLKLSSIGFRDFGNLDRSFADLLERQADREAGAAVGATPGRD